MKQKTLDAFVEAQLKELGIKPERASDDEVYSRLLEFCRKHKKAATRTDLKSQDYSDDRVGKILSRLIIAGRAVKLLPGKYIPVVKP